VRHRLELALFEAVRLPLRLLPGAWTRAAGRLLGRAAYRLAARHRAIALANLAQAFPERREEERARTARAAFAWFGQSLLEVVAAVPRLAEARFARFELVGAEHAARALAEGRGGLFFTAHWGAWEFLALAYGRAGIPHAVVARRLDNPHLEQRLRAFRTSTGNEVIDKREGFKPMLRALREGRPLAILVDQNVSREEGVFVDFFGRPAATTPALALLHLKTGAPLLPVFAEPAPGGGGRFEVGPPLEVERTGDREQDVLRITQAATRVLEDRIRRAPEYWLWMHRRWKTRPEAG
jgi:KDO2-lipid IV(A) lauroyltransferase